ncbi:MAG: histidine phosphatase family protein [Chloroflexaceae bacterium]|jgi:probable phosphoglycerate mutase|nr:histidine phosphatase family protein [Chloroflexaceae bacterium]
MPTTLYLIRHGETDWNMEGRWQGQTDVPLNSVGQRQAELLAARLRTEDIYFDAIYSSDLARAYQTAWAVGAALAVPVQLLPPLREIDLGAWSGLTAPEIKSRFPDEFACLERGEDVRRGGGESLAMLQQRAVTAVSAMVAQHPGETLAMVAHGGTIRGLLAHAVAHQGDAWPRFPHIGNTSISIVRCHSDHWEIVKLNDMQHLEATHDPELVTAPPDDAEQPQEQY